MSRTLAVAVGLALLAAAPVAEAQIQRGGAENFPGRNEVSIHTGVALGVSGQTPGGFKFAAEYGYRVSDLLWLNAGAQLVIGSSSGCYYHGGGEYDCGGFVGYGNTIEPEAGIKLKLKTAMPVIAYAKFQLAFIGIYNRGCGDDGFALAGRAGGGAEYFLTKNIGLGGELNLTAGPAFYGRSGRCGDRDYIDSHTETYVAVDFSIGAELVF